MKANDLRFPLMLGGAITVALFAASAQAEDVLHLSATLDGPSETAGGETGGSGKFFGEIDPDSGDLCYTLTVSGIGAPTAAHVHSGAAGSDGDVVTAINVTGDDGDECVALQRDVAKAIAADPVAYYVNVHTADFPKGAVRGQLAKTAE